MQHALLAILLILAPCTLAAPKVAESIDIAPVWSGHPVRFALLTLGKQNFVAFYDAERQLTVGVRTDGEKTLTLAKLDSRVVWDSHNSLVLATDRTGHLHLAGNMHAVPLVYFRTTRPGDITSFERVPAMTGENEKRCTYPIFFTGPDGELVFMYRDGSSGNGNQIFNVYDEAKRAWRRLLDKPLTDGEGKCNAYFHGPIRGPDGFYHLAWTWRDTPDCSSNHDICYARSKDLSRWESSTGRPLTLPITRATAETVDRVPVKGGVINGNVLIGFDAQKRVIITYHKYDAAGKTQVYNARREPGQLPVVRPVSSPAESGPAPKTPPPAREADAWNIRQISQWDYRWEFSGGGSIVPEIRLGPVKSATDGSLVQTYRHPSGSGAWKLDPESMATLGPAKLPATTPPELAKLQSEFPGMQVNWSPDSQHSGDATARFTLRWETLSANRDRPRSKPWPEPTMLRLIKVVDE